MPQRAERERVSDQLKNQEKANGWPKLQESEAPRKTEFPGRSVRSSAFVLRALHPPSHPAPSPGTQEGTVSSAPSGGKGWSSV